MNYPVLEILDELKAKLKQNRVVILQAPPGAGKSTVLPLQLLNEPWLQNKKTVMLEPRRLAARSVAMRMAELSGEEVGKTVGYRVRFESRVSRSTRMEVVTEGILTRMIQSDNSLEEIGLLIFDEFHERSLQADLALALSLQVQHVLRDDLKILIMSATLDGEKLSSLLQAPIVTSQGKQHPVTHYYVPGEQDAPIPVRVARAVRKALVEQPGDILAFLPGAGEIQRTAEILEQENLSASLHPLFGDLSFQKQQQAILPHPQGLRKIVLATSIAETSLTIEGISTVVDSGYSRVPRFDPRSGLTRLETIRVTKDAADQRAGRAGRLGPGVAYRLWSEGVHANLVPHRTPEILEADLAPLTLELSQWGVKDITDLTWITVPPAGAVRQAKELLTGLEALDGDRITDRGKSMLRFPTHPRIAHMLLEATDVHGKVIDPPIASLACDIAALLEERDPLGKEAGADLSLRVEVLKRWRSGERVNAERNALERIEKLAASWRKIVEVTVCNTALADREAGSLVLAAYPERLARQMEKHGERYKLANGRVAKLPPHDPLSREPWIAIAQLDAGAGEGKIFQAAALDENDLMAHAREVDVVSWDDERGMVVSAREKRVGNLLLSSRPSTVISEKEKVDVLCTMIREKGLRELGWEERLTSWQARVMSLRRWRPEEAWPDVSDENLLQTLETWLAPFLITIGKRIELQRLDPETILPTILPWELQEKLNRLAPLRLSVPSGSNISLQYHADGRPPVLEVRLQEVFGLLETPTVNEGRNKVMLHLLSPGYKPVQVTQDLRSFWTNTYAEVRKELRMRYPKHSWPEDPWTAQAVRGAKKRTG
jgi:ATP-dependent helicase HrpB